MATFEAVTSSNGISVTDPEAVKRLIGRYRIQPDAEVHVTGKTFGIWGYDWLDIRKVDGDEPDDHDATEEFFEELRPLLAEGQTLVVQSVGWEKCRFPLCAMAVVVTKERVAFHYLPSE